MSEHDLLVSLLNEKVTALLNEVAVLKRENRKLKRPCDSSNGIFRKNAERRPPFDTLQRESTCSIADSAE